MFKKTISYAVIFSILYPDIAFCMLGTEVENPTIGRKKIAANDKDSKNPSLFNVIQEQKKTSDPLVDLKEPINSESKSKNTQQPSVPSDCTMSDENQQDHSLSFSPPSNDSSPRSNKISPRSDEISNESPSKNRNDSIHSSLSLSLDSAESRFTQSSEEEKRNSPPVSIRISKETPLNEGELSLVTPLQQNAVTSLAILENDPETIIVNQENVLTPLKVNEETGDSQNSSLSVGNISALPTETSKSNPFKDEKDFIIEDLDQVLSSEKEKLNKEDSKVEEREEKVRERKDSSQFLVSPTLSTNILTHASSDISKEKETNLNTPIINLLLDEISQQQEKVEKTTSLPVKSTIPLDQNPDQEITVLEQFPTRSNVTLEKLKEKVETSSSSTDKEQRLIEKVGDNPNSSPRDIGQSSNSRRNSTDDSSGDVDSTHKTELQVDSPKDAIPLLMGTLEKEQKKTDQSESPLSLEKTSLAGQEAGQKGPLQKGAEKGGSIQESTILINKRETLEKGQKENQDESALALANSSLAVEKKSENSNNETTVLSVVSILSKDSIEDKEKRNEDSSVDSAQGQGGVLNFINMLKNNRDEKEKLHLQKGHNQVEMNGNSQGDINLEENVDLDEKTSLLFSKRPFKGKQDDLNVIQIEKKKKKPTCAQEWIYLYENPESNGVDDLDSLGADNLNSKGNSLKSYELITFSQTEDEYSDVGEGTSYLSKKKKNKTDDFLLHFSDKDNSKDLIIPINGDDPENGKGVGLGTDVIEKLSPAVKAFLLYAKDHINDGKITLRQGLIGGIGGLFIGICVGQAMNPILANGFRDIGGKFFYKIYDDAFWANSFQAHTSITLGIDSFARNTRILADFLGPSTDAFSIPSHQIKFKHVTIDPRKVTLGAFYTGAGVAALLPVYYLWFLEARGANYDPTHRSEYIDFFWWMAPALFIDALLLNGRAAKRWVDEKFNTYSIEQAFEGAHFSSARVIRKRELKRLKDLEQLFRHTPDDDIHNLYEQVLEHDFNEESNPFLSDETIKTAKTLRTLQALRHIHKDYQLPDEVKENWKKVTANILGWGIPILALGGRCITFFKVIYDLLNDLSPTNKGLNMAFGIIFGEIIASFFQGKVEVDATKTAVYELLGGEDTEGDSSHNSVWKGLRKVGKGYNYVQALWNTIPYILVGITATKGWPVIIQVLSLLFFGLADTFNSAVAFNESYGWAIANSDSLLSYVYTSPGYKRNKLIRLVRGYHQTFETMDPNVLMKVDALCDINNFRDEEKNVSSFHKTNDNEI